MKAALEKCFPVNKVTHSKDLKEWRDHIAAQPQAVQDFQKAYQKSVDELCAIRYIPEVKSTQRMTGTVEYYEGKRINTETRREEVVPLLNPTSSVST